MTPDFTFAGREWIGPVAGAALVLALLSVLIHWKAPGSRSIRALCLFLRLSAILVLALCVLEPQAVRKRAKLGENYFVILADNSQGLQIHDRGDARSRGEQLSGLVLGEKNAWLDVLGTSFQIRKYLFDEKLQGSRDYSELNFQGGSTALHHALHSLSLRFKGQPLAGIVLLTDGNATDIPANSTNFAGLPPIYPVVIGRDDPLSDVAVERTRSTRSVFEDAPTTVDADIRAIGYSGQRLKATLTELSTIGGGSSSPGPASPAKSNLLTGVTSATETLTVPSSGNSAPVTFRFRPAKPGVSFYRLMVQPESGAGTEEATQLNNHRTIAVDRGRGPHRILYVSGRPNWEFKFLNRALSEDPELELVGLIRMARREPKFDFLGRPGESSNPLYRGFGNTDPDETERYDQPVLIRLNTRDALELKSGFPKTAEELFNYEGLVLDDVEAAFFSSDQLSLIQKFVSERGGGFLMLGGADSLQDGKYQKTPVGDFLPVYLDRIAKIPPNGSFRWELTREGMLQPWMRTQPNEDTEKEHINQMPGFQVVNRLESVKPGASILSSLRGPGGAVLPAFVSQRFGNGRTAVMTVGDFWRWGMKDAAAHKDMDKVWRQICRWLVTDSPTPVSVEIEPVRDDEESAVKVRVKVKDKSFQPLDNASVQVQIAPVPDDAATPSLNNVSPTAPSPAPLKIEPFRLTAESSGKEPGTYETSFIPRWPGGYHIQVAVTNENGADLGHAEAGWSSDPVADEFRSLQPNRDLLERIARETGGEMVDKGDLKAWAAKIPSKAAPISEPWVEPLWHRSSVFALALLLLAMEWGLRRRHGMA